MSRNEQEPESERPSVWGTLGAMLGLGIVLAWASIFVIPSLEALGLAPRTASNFPFVALVLGAAWGFALRTSKGARELLTMIAAPLITGAVFYFFGLLVGALLLLVGVSEEVADYAPLGAFVLGAVLGCLPSVIVLFEGVQRMFAKEK